MSLIKNANNLVTPVKITDFDYTEDMLDEERVIKIPTTFEAKLKKSDCESPPPSSLLDFPSSSSNSHDLSSIKGFGLDSLIKTGVSLIKTTLASSFDLERLKSKGDETVFDYEIEAFQLCRREKSVDLLTSKRLKHESSNLNRLEINSENEDSGVHSKPTKLKDIILKIKRRKGVARLVLENEIIKELLSTTKRKMEQLLEISWANNYYKYLNANKEEPINIMPPIDNSSLLDQNLKLKPDLKNGVHFVLVHQNIWDFLRGLYGGGPSVGRIRHHHSKEINKPGGVVISSLKKDYSKHNLKLKVAGLKNRSNCCFLNATFQCLLSLDQLNEFFLSEKYRSVINKTEKKPRFCKAYAISLLNFNNNDSNSISLNELKHFIKPTLDPSEQQDAHEFFILLINKLQEELSEPKKNNSIIDELFSGKTKTSLKCRNCDGVSEVIDTFYDISLPITKKKSTLIKCLDSFFKEEGWIDSYKCEKCQMNSQAKKTVVVCEQPKILVLHLKRFKMFPKRQKLFNSVEFPMDEFILKQFCQEDVKPVNYKLKSFAIHLGNADNGHYISYAERESKWFFFNDEKVKEIPASKLPRKDAYLLFYSQAE